MSSKRSKFIALNGATLVVFVYAVFVIFSLCSSRVFRDYVDGGVAILAGDSSQKIYYRAIGSIPTDSSDDKDWGTVYGQKVVWVRFNPDGVFNYLYDNEPGMQVIKRSLYLPFSDYKKLLSWKVPFPVVVPLSIHLLCVFFVQFAHRAMVTRRCLARARRIYIDRALYSAIHVSPFVIAFQVGRVVWSSREWAAEYWGTLYVIGLGSLTYYLYCALFIVAYFLCIIAASKLQVRAKHGSAGRKCARCRFVKTEEVDRCPECGLVAGEWVDSKLHVRSWLPVLIGSVAFFLPVMVASVFSVLGMTH